MADDVTLPGTGAVVATDDVGGAQFQRVKLTLGADGVNGGDLQAALVAAIAAGSSDVAATGAAGTLFGWTMAETAGAAATAVVRDGASNAGGAIGYVNLASNESVRDWFGPQGIKITTGVWLERVTGSLAATFWYV